MKEFPILNWEKRAFFVKTFDWICSKFYRIVWDPYLKRENKNVCLKPKNVFSVNYLKFSNGATK